MGVNLNGQPTWIKLNGFGSIEDPSRYYAERDAAIAAGQPTWRVNNFREESGRTFFYYKQGERKGEVYTEFGRVLGSAAFHLDGDIAIALNPTFISLDDAVRLVETIPSTSKIPRSFFGPKQDINSLQ